MLDLLLPEPAERIEPMAKRPFLRWLTDVPRPYTSVLFRALAASDQVDLMVHYGNSSMGSHPWDESIAEGFKSALYRRRLGVDWGLVSLAAKDPAIFVLAGWNDPTMTLCGIVRRLRGLPYWVVTDTPDENWVPRGPLKARVRKLWLRWLLGGANRVWGTGVLAQKRLIELGGNPDRVGNLPYFIDLDRYGRARRRSGPDFVLGSAGQLVARKEIATALKALARLEAGGRSNWVYRIVGAGPEEGALRELSRSLGIEAKIEFLGWLKGDSLLDFYSGCDVFVHPCEFEPWGVVVMEAMASGAAVVCSDSTFVALDWVEPEVSGLIHRTWDDEDLASKLEWLLSDPDRAARVGAEGSRVVRRWPVERGVEAVAEHAQGVTR